MKENSPICPRAAATDERHPQRVAERRTIRIAASGLPIMTTASVADHHRGREQVLRIEQHPDRTKKGRRRHRASEGHRRRPAAEIGPADDQPRQEGAELHRDAEEQGRTDGDAEGDHQHREREEFARTARGDLGRGARESPARRSVAPPR